VLWIRLDGEGALHRQLHRAMRDAILEGRLEPGHRLPSTRAFARELGLSRNTVLQAVEQLIAEGYATGRIGSGTYVASPLPASWEGSHGAGGAGGEARGRGTPCR
jgi:GntR family transcriptional regulator/MocR family aminotransferase